MLRRANGATALYLPGMEVTWDPAAGTEEATRYFEHAGETVAVREDDDSLHWVFSDHHGTGQMTVDAVWGEVAQRRMTVFGQDRGATGEWPGERGFVDGTVDASTGLTQLGARSYDADLGRFISVDPLMDLTDDQQMHGYVYSNNNPVSFTDPTGLLVDAWAIHAKKRIEYYGGSGSPRRSGSYGSSGRSNGGNRPGYPASSRPPSVYTPPVSVTNSPETNAQNDASWLSAAGSAVGGWFSDRYTTDDGLNW